LLNIILPTYNIDVNICLDDDDDFHNYVIELLIEKNQYGEFSYSFIPQNVNDNVYIGELIVNIIDDNIYIPLKQLIKILHNKYLNGKKIIHVICTYTHHTFFV